jgi:FAD/FMN-containing dehydrogenase
MARSPATDSNVIAERLGQVVGPQVVVDPEIISSYTTDWTGRFVGRSTVVVRPGSADEVAGVISVCRELGLSLVPQGGNTGLVGGSVPLRGEIVLSMQRFGSIDPVDDLAGQVTAGAGVTLEALHAAAEAAGWSYGVDIASRGSATVGGTVATNAGGLHVIRYGDTRAQVVGMEAVLGTGQVISHLGGLLKDNTGYHWPSFLCGSEGTLAVVTAVRLRLMPSLSHKTVALLAFSDVGKAVAAATVLRRALPTLESCELMVATGMELVCEAVGIGRPFPESHRVYLLVEVADLEDPTDSLAEAVDAVMDIEEVAVATEPSQRAALWRYREEHTDAINTLGPPHKLDVTLPHSALAEFIERVPSVVAATDGSARTWLFGHVGDGNIHVNVSGLAPDDDRVDDAVFRLVGELDGSISAEHGIGTAKKRWLHLSRTPAEVAAFRAIKQALDPDGVLNPNVLLPDEEVVSTA